MFRHMHHSQGKYISLAAIFVCIFAFIILCSFAYKMIHLMFSSNVDPSHQYIFSLSTGENTADIVALDGSSHSLSLLQVNNSPSIPAAIKELSIPVDISLPNKIESNTAIQDSLSNAVFSEKSLNFFDKLKLWWAVRSIASRDIQTEEVSLPFDFLTQEETINTLFLDQDMYQDDKKIRIVNAADISGLGNTVAKYLSHIGAHVIAVDTADSMQNISSITYSGSETYTTERLERILHISAHPSSTTDAIADITVTIGKDRASAFE